MDTEIMKVQYILPFTMDNIKFQLMYNTFISNLIEDDCNSFLEYMDM